MMELSFRSCEKKSCHSRMTGKVDLAGQARNSRLERIPYLVHRI